MAPTANSTSADQEAYQAFASETLIDKKIQLGEEFDLRYPQSSRKAAVDDQLVYLYYNRQDWPKFYAIADIEIKESPNDLAVLRLAGWVIPHVYDPTDPAEPARLDRAEKYEKHALALIAAMKKPSKMTDGDFAQEKVSESAQAHSGLGMTYFRRREYEKSLPELQAAITDEAQQSAPQDLYALGIAFQNLSRTNDAVDAFTKCGAIDGELKERCKSAAGSPAQEAAFVNFDDETNSEAEIKLGEQFDTDFPESPYRETVQSMLVNLYNNKGDWTAFYATADKVISEDPDNAPVLTLVGWVIPHVYEASEKDAATKLDQAEQYEKHAIELIAGMQLSGNVTPDEFNAAKAEQLAKAHSGLGMTYFRRNDFSDSARELQLAVNGAPDTTQTDFYILGVDLMKMRRTRQAVDAFTRCSKATGMLREQCKRDADTAMKGAGMSAPAEAPENASASAPAVNVPVVADVAPVSAVTARVVAAAADIPPPNSLETAPIRAETIVIPIRVVVRDTKGRAVANLKKENFKLYQDGKLVEVSNFTAVVPTPEPDSPLPSTSVGARLGAPDGKGGMNIPTTMPGESAAAAPVAASRFVVLFFDDVHLYFNDMAQTVGAAEKFLSTLGPQDRVAIVTASGKGGTDFTGDRNVLYEALKVLKPEPFPGGTIGPTRTDKPCPPAMTYTEANAIVDGDSEPVLLMAGGDYAACDGIAAENPQMTEEAGEAHARAVAVQARSAGEEAIDADFVGLQRSVHFLAMKPGQRTLVMVSPGFVFGSHGAAFADLTNLAIHNDVVIDTLDAKGVQVRGADGEWDSDRFQRQGYGHFEVEQPILEDLADSTGGLFIKNNNDFAGVMREFAAEPGAYYLLAYVPQNLPLDGKYHALKVSLDSHSTYSVQARRGFYASSKAETPEQVAEREIEDALFSTDTQHDLPVKLETTVIPGANGAQTLDVKADVDTSQLHFVREGGISHEQLTVAAALFDSDGNYVAGTQQVDKMDLDDATLAQLNKSGFYLEMTLDVKPGDYVLRLVSRDANDEHLSAESSEVEVSK